MSELTRTPEEIREFIAAQMCPWCPRGPFKVLARHTNEAHGVDRFELRKVAGLHKTAKGICAPEFSEYRAQEGADRWKAMTDEEKAEFIRLRDAGMKEKYTSEMRRENSRQWHDSRSEEERVANLRRLNTAMPLEERNRRVSAAKMRIDPKVRSERARAAMMSLSPEQRREQARKANAGMTPEERARMTRKSWAEKSDDEKKAIARKVAAGRLEGGFQVKAADGARLKSLREAAGMSQREFAELLGKSGAATSRLESGKGGLTPDQASIVERKFGFRA